MKLRYLFIFFLLLLFQKVSAQESIVVLPGSIVQLSASATNADSYVWFHNGNVIPNEETMYYSATEEGIYWVLAISEHGCFSNFSEDLEIIFGVPPPKGPKYIELCENENPTLNDIEITGENIKWYSSADSSIPLDNSTLLVDDTNYYASQTIDGEESEGRIAVYVTLIDCSNPVEQDLLSISKTVNVESAIIGTQVTFTIKVKNLGTRSAHSILVNEHITSGYDYNSHTATHGTYSALSGEWNIPILNISEEATLKITVTILEKGDHKNIASITSSDPEDKTIDNNEAQASVELECLKIYNEFSPNNDGNNDYFKIDCIENYPGNVFKVFNRRGQVVYEKANYNNSWKGQANKAWGVPQKGKDLPIGTYFYSLDLRNGETLVGWLYIIR